MAKSKIIKKRSLFSPNSLGKQSYEIFANKRVNPISYVQLDNRYLPNSSEDINTNIFSEQIDIYISIFNNGDVFSFGIEAWNEGIDAVGTVDWGLGQSPEIWTAPYDYGSYIEFSNAYNEGDYHIILTFDNQEQVARLELDSTEVNSTRCITSITGLQVLQNPYNIDIDIQLLNSSLDVGNIPSLTDCFALDNQLTELNLQGSTGLTEIEFYNNELSTLDISGLINLDYVQLQDNQLTQQAVDSILVTLDQNGLTNGTINLGGSGNAAPSSIGLSAIDNLVDKGWEVSYN